MLRRFPPRHNSRVINGELNDKVNGEKAQIGGSDSGFRRARILGGSQLCLKELKGIVLFCKVFMCFSTCLKRLISTQENGVVADLGSVLKRTR